MHACVFRGMLWEGLGVAPADDRRSDGSDPPPHPIPSPFISVPCFLGIFCDILRSLHFYQYIVI